MKKTLFLLCSTLALLTLSNCRNDTTSVQTPENITVSSLRFIGERRIANLFNFSNTTVGGISGIDFANGIWYLLSDDRCQFAPAGQTPTARYYTATLAYTASSFDSITLRSVTNILQPNGSQFPSGSPTLVALGAPDPEAIRFDASSNSLYWSSEGDRVNTTTAARTRRLVNPFIREMQLNGSNTREFTLPPNFVMDTTSSPERGPRDNGVFESLTITPSGNFIFVAIEEPLFDDGGRSDSLNQGVIRIVRFNKATGQQTGQFAYRMERRVPNPTPSTAFFVHGVTEILALSDTRMLVMERSFAVGASPDYNVRIFEADLGAATDISNTARLIGATFTAATKRQIIDLVSLNLPRVDNMECMAFGPNLPNGRRSFVIASDDNFNAAQVTQFLVFEVNP